MIKQRFLRLRKKTDTTTHIDYNFWFITSNKWNTLTILEWKMEYSISYFENINKMVFLTKKWCLDIFGNLDIRRKSN